MVKFVMSFLFSFKSFPENGVQFYPHLSEKTEDDTEELYLRFKAHPDRKNICNITYIIPGPRELVEKKISVACWSPMLKVYNRKEDYHFQTECTGDKTWAAFSVRQTLDNIKLEQFKNIFPKSLEFYFNEDQKSVQRFRNDPYGAYFSPKIPKENRFGPVFYLKDLTKQPARVKPEYGTIQQNNRKKEVSVSRKQPETTTRIKSSDPDICRTVAAAHLHKILKILRTKKDTNPPMTPRSPSNCAMFLPVAKLFYDKSVWVLKNDRPMTRNVQDVYVFVTVYSFLDEEARKIINPISIYLQSLQYLPLKELQAKGISKVFVEYELDPIIPKTRTKVLYVRQRSIIPFKDLHVFFTEQFSPLSIMSCFQTKKLYVRVIGIKDSLSQEKDDKVVVYGEDLNDDRLSSCIKTPFTILQHQRVVKSPVPKSKSTRVRSTKRRSSASRSVRNKMRKKFEQLVLFQSKAYHALIGTARIDLSPLVFGNSSVIAYEELSSLPVLINNPRTVDFERLSITLVHEDLCKYEDGVFNNRSLYENNTMIKLTAKCAFLLTPQLVNTDPCINYAFSRVITILVDKEFATETLQAIFMYNRESLDMRGYSLPLVPFRKMYKPNQPPVLKSIFTFQSDNSIISDEEDSYDPIDTTTQDAYFTGFCIDCVNQVLMYVEGPTISTFPTLLTELVKFNTSQGRILYSSDLIYETRIYDVFKKYGGLYCITMKSTIDNFLNKGSSLCYGVSVPEPAWKALKMISKLSSTKSVLEAVQENYLPRPEQLISFDIEFGTPHCIVK